MDTKIIYDDQINQDLIKEKKVAVIGFGSQGHAHALNLHESGVDVTVGLRETSETFTRAKEMGLNVSNVEDAVSNSEVVMLLLPDQLMADVYNETIAPVMKENSTLFFAHGFNIHFNEIKPREDISVAMVAPKGPGHLLRRTYEEGSGMPCLVAVENDTNGNTHELALSYASAIGGGRAGILDTTFKEETETDLFGEQVVLCGGLTELIKNGFETLVEAGYQPESAYFETLHEVKLIVDLMYEGGFEWMRHSISDTAEYGDFSRGPRIVNEDTKKEMKKVLEEIQSGSFAKEFMAQSREGSPFLNQKREEASQHQIESVGKELRSMMPFLSAKDVKKRQMSEDQLIIFDTTLRDGEQSPGIALTPSEKLLIAQQLEKLKVDVIEAGFAASSPGDWDGVNLIAKNIQNSTIASLARCVPDDIEKAWEAIKVAKKSRIHVFTSTSDIHMEHMLRKTKEEVLHDAKESVRYAKNLCDDIEFSAQDATRTDKDFLIEILKVAVEEGATTINVPDTVGYATPSDYLELLRGVYDKVKGKNEDIIISTHCHNDLGLAVANSLTAIKAGARQIEGAINGIGERAGNTSTEEIIMAVKTRQDQYGVDINAETTEILETSRLVSKLTGYPVQYNKAVVGKNAFSHESGIHQHGYLRNSMTYEIMTPDSVGQEAKIILGKHSGRAGFKDALDKLNIKLDEEAFNSSFDTFKKLADRKGEIVENELRAIVGQVETSSSEIKLVSVSVNSKDQYASARVTLDVHGKELTEEAEGDGMIHAAFTAVKKILETDATLIDYRVESITKGADATAEIVTIINDGHNLKQGRAVSTDVVQGSVESFLNALNR